MVKPLLSRGKYNNLYERRDAMNVIKRDGKKVEFDKNKISIAIQKAMKSGIGKVSIKVADNIAEKIEQELLSNGRTDVSISTIEGMVYDQLIKHKKSQVAKAYEGYRAVREYQGKSNTIDQKVLGVVKGDNSDIKDNSNKNTKLISTMRDLVAEEVSKDIALRTMLPTKIAQAHNDGIIYIHDLGHYLNPSFNCCLVNLEDMLQNGTVVNGKLITKPHSFRTACIIATQIIAQVASGQFGGQTITLSHLAPFVRISKEKIEKEVYEEAKEILDSVGEQIDVTTDLDKIVNKRLVEEVSAGIQTFQYQINTLQTSNGQAPFLSVLMYINENPEYEVETAMLIEEMLKQRIKGMQNEVGAWVTPAFPKLLYVTDVNNIYAGTKYFHLTQLAAKCISKRMMPDALSAKKLKENYEGNVVAPMGCRAFLSPYKGPINNIEGQYKWWGRFNMGLTSINLADAGLSAQGDIEAFWDILDERLELCYESLMLRYEKLKDVTSDVSPIHWQHGALARLPKHTPIYHLLQNGYATISLGYMGLYECVKALIGVSHTKKPEGEQLAIDIMKHLKAKVLEWKEKTGLGFALYGTPAESLTDRFAHATRNRWGVIEGITDRDFLTNSYHVFVEEPIDAYSKLLFESQFHAISSGGAISYIETPNMSNNVEAIIELLQFMHENVQYAEFNTKLDYCQVCNYDGEILYDKEKGWYCPNCGNTDTDKMNIVRRTCGYLGENLWNEGRTEEITHRVLHIGAE